MVATRMTMVLAIAAMLATATGSVSAEDSFKIAIGQGGGWEQCVSELGQSHGILKKARARARRGLHLRGSGETCSR